MLHIYACIWSDVLQCIKVLSIVDYFSKMTSLKDEVPRSELVCMLAVPAAYTIHDLVKFTAPVG